MRRLSVFNQITVDGYFTSLDGDISWAKKARPDPDWVAFVEGNAAGGGELIFGRKTYEMMAGYWPTAAAKKQQPAVAERMNNGPKVVFSRTLKEAAWNNTRLVKGDLVAEVTKMKQEPGPPMVILGSGSIVAQLSEARLIDEYQMVVNPVALGRGRTMLEDMSKPLDLRLTRTRAFQNGNVLECYERG